MCIKTVLFGTKMDLTHYVNEANREAKMTPQERAAKDAARQARIDELVAQGSKVMESQPHETVGPVANPPATSEEPKLPVIDSVSRYVGRQATSQDIAAGKTLDGTWKYWPGGHYGTTPHKEQYINQTKFKYNWWRRIEDTRRVYSVDGILLSSGKQYTLELSAYPATFEEQKQAIHELLNATIEYGNVCPGPFTERWVETDNESLEQAQHIINALYDFYQRNKLLDFADSKQRLQVWDYIREFDNMYVALEYVEKYWTHNNTLNDTKGVKQITKRIKRAMR